MKLQQCQIPKKTIGKEKWAKRTGARGGFGMGFFWDPKSHIPNPGIFGIFFPKKSQIKNPGIFWDFWDWDFFSSGIPKSQKIRFNNETLQISDWKNPKKVLINGGAISEMFFFGIFFQFWTFFKKFSCDLFLFHFRIFRQAQNFLTSNSRMRASDWSRMVFDSKKTQTWLRLQKAPVHQSPQARREA